MEPAGLAEGNSKAGLRSKPVRWALLGLGCGAGAAVWLLVQEPGGQVQRLPDGSTLELRGWTTPPNHTFVDGKLWEQALLMLPAPISGNGGFRSSHGTVLEQVQAALFDRNPNVRPRFERPSATDRLVLWFRSSNISRDLDSAVPIWLDNHGCRIPASKYSSPLMWGFQSHTGGRQWCKSWPSIIPSHVDGRLQYQLVSPTGGTPIATFDVSGIPVPARTGFPKGASCPVSVKRDGTIFTVSRLERLSLSASPFDLYRAKFEYSDPGDRRRDWEPASITVIDTAGNQLITDQVSVGEDGFYEFPGLCRSDAAWKVAIGFVPRDPLVEDPDAVWTIRNLPVPRRGETLKPDVEWTADGNRLRLACMGDLPAFWLSKEDREPFPSALGVSGRTRDGVTVTLFQIADQEGEMLDLASRSISVYKSGIIQQFAAGESRNWFPLHRRRHSRRLDLTFHVFREATVEFLVKPP